MHRCPNCKERGLSTIGVIFMVHDERVIWQECGTAFVVPKSKKNTIIGTEYTLLLLSVALSIYLKTLWPTGGLLIVFAIVRAMVIPKIAIPQKQKAINRLRRYRRK